tara:strand:+ start:1260 stop:1451 length:192 start_codon:yes stop_codon:yes gene_type:complete
MKILKDARKILKEYGEATDLSLGNDKNINPINPDYAWFISKGQDGTTYEVQVRPTTIQSNSTQ